MAWIELHQAVWTHRKTAALAESLGISETYAAAHLIRFWTWALDNAPDGALRCSCRVVARAADWGGDADQFMDALAGTGWLDPDGEHYVIHDWGEYAGRLIDRREQDKERKRRSRGEVSSIKDEPVRRTSGRQDADVLRTVPNRTQHNTTQPDQDTENAAVAAAPEPDAESGIDYSRVIFDEYRVRIQPKAKFIDDARRKIRTRLRSWSPQELRAAIEHFAADAWQMEHNGHRGAAWFFASDTRIEQYVNLTLRKSSANGRAHAPSTAVDRFAKGVSFAEATP